MLVPLLVQVDVFSAGVVHYVMLFYPHKPFFKQSSQQQIMQMKVRPAELPHSVRPARLWSVYVPYW